VPGQNGSQDGDDDDQEDAGGGQGPEPGRQHGEGPLPRPGFHPLLSVLQHGRNHPVPEGDVVGTQVRLHPRPFGAQSQVAALGSRVP